MRPRHISSFVAGFVDELNEIDVPDGLLDFFPILCGPLLNTTDLIGRVWFAFDIQPLGGFVVRLGFGVNVR